MDAGVGTRGFLDAQGQSEEREDARDGPKADARLSKELQSQVDHVDLGHGGESIQPRLELMQAGLSLLQSLSGSVGSRLEASVLCALVALSLASLCSFVFPLISTVRHFGQLAHDGASRQLDGPRPSKGGKVGIQISP